MNFTLYTALVILLAAAIVGCKKGDNRVTKTRLQSPLSVTHLAPQAAPLDDPFFPHMWYYRTELRNDSDRDLRVIWFESYTEFEGIWYPGNASGQVLRSEEFSSWYTEGDPIIDGVIPPGATAVCDVNWYGSEDNSLTLPRMKWAYIAVDEFGFDYYVESLVSADILNHVHQTTSAGDLTTASSGPEPNDTGQPPSRPESEGEQRD